MISEKITQEQALAWNTKGMQLDKITEEIKGNSFQEKITNLNEEQTKGVALLMSWILSRVKDDRTTSIETQANTLALISPFIDTLEIPIDEDIRLAAIEDALENGYIENKEQ